jgi:carotenoid cleavage dioxygenase-like enzyme
VILDDAFELPRINSLHKNAKQYQFAYGLGVHKTDPSDFVNQIVKLDMDSGEVDLWYEDGCYPGEPVFVPAPNAKSEDAGLILSVILASNEGKSFLLILDGSTFGQIARAPLPHPIPFGFHGQFYEDV